jgi:hypothetical protein
MLLQGLLSFVNNKSSDFADWQSYIINCSIRKISECEHFYVFLTLSIKTKPIAQTINQMKEEIDMAKYVDGFVLVIPDGKEAEYRKMAEEGKDAWMRHGALSYFECRGDDLTTKEMGGVKPLDQKSNATR